MRFAENVCAEKSAEPLQSVNNNLPTHDLPKFQHFYIISSYIKNVESQFANSQFAKNMFFCQIVSRQIVGNKFGAGKL